MEASLTNYLTDLMKETLKNSHRVKEVTLKDLNLLSTGLGSIYQVHRKISSILILYLCDLHQGNIDIFLKNKLLLSFAGYIGIGLNLRGELKKTKKFIKKLHKDPQFMKEEIKSNRFYIKFFRRVKGDAYHESRKEVFILTLTEITHFVGAGVFESMPDPVQSFVWCVEKKGSSKKSSLKEILEQEYETKQMLYDASPKHKDLSRSCSIGEGINGQKEPKGKAKGPKERDITSKKSGVRKRGYRITRRATSIDPMSSPLDLKQAPKMDTPSTTETKKFRLSVSRGRRRRGRSHTTIERDKEKMNIFKQKNAPLFRIRASVERKREVVVKEEPKVEDNNPSKLVFQRRRKKRTVSYIQPASGDSQTPSFFKMIKRKKIRRFKDQIAGQE